MVHGSKRCRELLFWTGGRLTLVLYRPYLERNGATDY